jgi:hypothetical protein
MDEE